MSTTDKMIELEKRIATLEKVQADGIDRLIREIQALFANDAVLGEAATTHDDLLASMKALLIEKRIFSEDAVSEKLKEIHQIRKRAEAFHKQQEEMTAVSRRAEEAAKEQAGHPKEAFIFGS
jgi:predicted nucleotidyltransferase